MNWNILVISGKNTKKYFVSTGEGTWIKAYKLYNIILKKYKKIFI